MRFPVFLSLVALLSTFTCERAAQAEHGSVQAIHMIIDSVQTQWIPDRRVNRMDVELISSTANPVLRGETTLPAAKDMLVAALAEQGIRWQDSIAVLPLNALGEKVYALTTTSVANLRSAPGHSQEMATQALLGTPIRVLKQQKEWYMVQTPDGYIAWLNRGELHRRSNAEMEAWKAGDRVAYEPHFGHSYSTPNANGPKYGDLVRGCLLERVGETGTFAQVKYPDGTIAYVPSNELTTLSIWLKHSVDFNNDVFKSAKALIGIPYLWGGTSPKGMDCSGFTKTVYWQNGYILPRDASQQVHAGTEVALDEQLSKVMSGDFLFFGRYREDGSPKVTHVGIYLGEGQFIHSGADNGAIRIQGLLADNDNYAAHRRESLLFVKRIGMMGEGVVAVRDSEWYF